MTTLLVALVALSIFISPMVFAWDGASTTMGGGAAQLTDSPHHGMHGRMGQSTFTSKGQGKGGGGKGQSKGRSWNVSPRVVIAVLSKWSGYSTDTLTSVMQEKNIGVKGIVLAAVLSKAGNISLDDAASVVAEGNLKTYITDNNLTDKFKESMQDFMKAMKKAYAEHRNNHKGNGKGHNIGGKMWNTFVSTLAEWGNVSVGDITSMVNKYNLRPGRAINAVVLHKVANISLDEAASVVADGNLETYLEDKGLTEQFQEARQEIMGILREKAQEIKAADKEKIAEAVSNWSGIDKAVIKKMIEEKGVGYTVNVVVLVKVGNVSLDDAKAIVDDGNLGQYLKDNDLVQQFREAKISLMRTIRDILKP
jgi:DNA-binding FrmR family transcriptional regulator